MGCVGSSVACVRSDRRASSDDEGDAAAENEHYYVTNGNAKRSASNKNKMKNSNDTKLNDTSATNGDTTTTTLDDSQTLLTNGDCRRHQHRNGKASKRKTKPKRATPSAKKLRCAAGASPSSTTNGDVAHHVETDGGGTQPKFRKKKTKNGNKTSKIRSKSGGENSKFKTKSLFGANGSNAAGVQDDDVDAGCSRIVGAKLAYANEDPSTSPTIPNGGAGASSSSSGGGRTSSKTAAAHGTQNGSLSSLNGKQTKSDSNGCRSPVSTDALYKNFQNRLLTTQTSKTIKLTDSQVEFFRLLDEKIERGQESDSS